MTYQSAEVGKWIETLANRLAEVDEPDEEGIEAAAVADGCDAELAMLIMEYLPSAFAWPTMSDNGVKIVPGYERRLTNGKVRKCNWEDDPVWSDTRAFVSTVISDGRWNQYKSIAFLSAEVDAISKAFIAGATWEDLTLATAPIGELAPDSPWLPPDRRSFLQKLFG